VLLRLENQALKSQIPEVGVKIVILAENTAYKAPYAEWGFSALIKDGKKKYLFDVGLSGNCVLQNAKYLQQSLNGLDGIIISHGHDDHGGGLEKVLSEIGGSEVFANKGVFQNKFSKMLGKHEFSGLTFSQSDLENKFASKFFAIEGILQLSKNVFVLSNVPMVNPKEKISSRFYVEKDGKKVKDEFQDESNLILKTQAGIVIVTGCSHRGLINIIQSVKEHFSEKIHAVVGGAHLFDASQKQYEFVIESLKDENIDRLILGHCTGFDRLIEMKSVFKEKLEYALCGSEFVFT
jgi:7,8-dihydropterin-6-yl-methyl-4-(beta-D-ribofuranosyl)aminobenzene 5'-phosphate synthase